MTEAQSDGLEGQSSSQRQLNDGASEEQTSYESHTNNEANEGSIKPESNDEGDEEPALSISDQFDEELQSADEVRKCIGLVLIVVYAAATVVLGVAIVCKMSLLFDLDNGIAGKVLATEGANVEGQRLAVAYVSVVVVSQTVLILTLIVWCGRMIQSAFDLLTPIHKLTPAAKTKAVESSGNNTILTSIEERLNDIFRFLRIGGW